MIEKLKYCEYFEKGECVNTKVHTKDCASQIPYCEFWEKDKNVKANSQGTHPHPFRVRK